MRHYNHYCSILRIGSCNAVGPEHLVKNSVTLVAKRLVFLAVPAECNSHLRCFKKLSLIRCQINQSENSKISKTYLRYVSLYLSAENFIAIFHPSCLCHSINHHSCTVICHFLVDYNMTWSPHTKVTWIVLTYMQDRNFIFPKQ